MALHKNLGIADGIHIPYAWTYASASSREAATGLVTADIGKFARQTDDDSIWMLVAITPTWVQVGGGGTVTPTRLTILAKKSSSGTIPKGSPVYLVGYDAVNEAEEVEAAKADSCNTMPCVGIANEELTDSAEGQVVVLGIVADLNTSSYAVNDMLYVSAATAGALTNVRPTGGTNLVQSIAEVAYSHATNGIILVIGAGRPNALPNLTTGKSWIGDADAIPVETTPLAVSDTTPVDVTKASASAGTATDASRRDHKHDVSTGTPVATGLANAEGTATSLARSDHVHEHVHGSQAQDGASESESSTSSTSFVQKLRLTTPSIPAGRYRVGWNYEWNYASAANDALAQVQVDDATTLMEMFQEPADAGADQWNNKGGFGYVDLTAGTHDIDLDYRAGNALYSMAIRRARLEIWRVS